MEILPYAPSLAPDLAVAYNAAVRNVPHCYAVGAEPLAAAIAETKALDGDAVELHSQQAFVATEGGSVLGFIHAGVRPPKDPPGPEKGMIRCFWYVPGRRGAGQLLLEAAEDALRGRGVRAVEVFDQHYTYEFYQLHSSFLSDHLGQVGALLTFNGYRKAGGKVFLDWPDFEPVDPAPTDVAAEIVVERKPAEGRRPNIAVKAMMDGKQIGVCHCGRIADYTNDEPARDWFFVHWLAVDDPHQGRGLGKHLLASAFVENRAAGYRHGAISTAWDNYRAFVFYSNAGFHVVDWTYGLRRELEE